MLTLLLAAACSNPTPKGLPQEGIEARDLLAQALETKNPNRVEQAAEIASQWQGQDAKIDRLLGDALANVLMHVDTGLKLLNSRPDPQDPNWQRAVLLATARTGNTSLMKSAWEQSGRPIPPFQNPVTQSMVDRLKRDPSIGLDAFEYAINTCDLIDSQPSVGRSALEYPVSTDLIKVAEWVGADAVVMSRPLTQVDRSRHEKVNHIHCSTKLALQEWPEAIGTTLTVGLSSGSRRVFVDIKQSGNEQWSYATSDPVAGGHWIQAMNLADTLNAEKTIRNRFPNGLWAQPQKATE